MGWTCTNCSVENDEENTKRCDCCGEPRKLVQKKIEMWICKNCQMENEESAKRCGVCEEPRVIKKILAVSQELSEEEEDEDMNLDIMGIGKGTVTQAKNTALEIGKEGQNSFPDKVAVVLAADTVIMRLKIQLDFVEDHLVKIWGLKPQIPIILELSVILENLARPPTIRVFQTSDPNLDSPKMENITNVGLEWQLRERITEWMGSKLSPESETKNWPPSNEPTSTNTPKNFFANLLSILQIRIQNCVTTCVICDAPLQMKMIKPSICSNKLCVYSHEQYGLGADVAGEMRENPQVVDLLITLAAVGSHGRLERFTPYPEGVEVKQRNEKGKEITYNFMLDSDDTVKDVSKLQKIWHQIPSIAEIAKYKETKLIKEFLDTIHPLCFPTLRWCITSNRTHLALLEPKYRIKEMNTDHQFLFLSSPPEKEAVFNKLKAKNGSFYAFHGSDTANWHCIFRIGLKNYSNTEFMTNAAAFGAGIYLSPYSSTSMGYSRSSVLQWPNSAFQGSLCCLAMCEVINAGYTANPHYVIPNEDHVMTRYFFIYTSNSCPSVAAASLKPKNPIPKKGQNNKN